MSVPSDLSQQILRLQPNVRWEPPSAETGYTWGKPAAQSTILEILNAIRSTTATAGAAAGASDDSSLEQVVLQEWELDPAAIVAERWLISDDPADGSVIQLQSGETIPLRAALDAEAAALLGPTHLERHGAYLHCVMKQLDTNAIPSKGSLSVQIHPKPGHPTRPAKPEMWTGRGSVYLGWNRDVTTDEIREAHAAGRLEDLLNDIEMEEDYILVEGGMIHAIRYDSFLYEWSMAPDATDVAKGTLRDATVAPYDRTDGKTQRPGKEKLEESLALLKESDALHATAPADLVTTPEVLLEQRGVRKERVFTTDHVIVERYVLEPGTSLAVELERAMPLYVDAGSATFSAGRTQSMQLGAGQEAFIPYATEQVTITAAEDGITLFSWYAP